MLKLVREAHSLDESRAAVREQTMALESGHSPAQLEAAADEGVRLLNLQAVAGLLVRDPRQPPVTGHDNGSETKTFTAPGMATELYSLRIMGKRTLAKMHANAPFLFCGPVPTRIPLSLPPLPDGRRPKGRTQFFI